MPTNSVHKLAVKSIGETAFSLHSVISNPRQCTPIDLQLAGENLKIHPLTADPPHEAVQLASYLLTEFFAILHRSGLYNRQKALWEALARTHEVHCERLKAGFIVKIELPIWELRFVDDRGRKLLLVRFLDDSSPNLVDVKNGKDATRFLQNAIKQAEKFKIENAAFAGLILCCEERMPDSIVSDVLKLTGDDAVARYQSLLPTISCPIDLIVRQGDRFSIVLPVLPNRVKSVSSAIASDIDPSSPPGDATEEPSELIV
jgi:hypothetical protein